MTADAPSDVAVTTTVLRPSTTIVRLASLRAIPIRRLPSVVAAAVVRLVAHSAEVEAVEDALLLVDAHLADADNTV